MIMLSSSDWEDAWTIIQVTTAPIKLKTSSQTSIADIDPLKSRWDANVIRHGPQVADPLAWQNLLSSCVPIDQFPIDGTS